MPRCDTCDTVKPKADVRKLPGKDTYRCKDKYRCEQTCSSYRRHETARR